MFKALHRNAVSEIKLYSWSMTSQFPSADEFLFSVEVNFPPQAPTSLYYVRSHL